MNLRPPAISGRRRAYYECILMHFQSSFSDILINITIPVEVTLGNVKFTIFLYFLYKVLKHLKLFYGNVFRT